MKKLKFIFLIIAMLLIHQAFAQKKAKVLTTADTLNNLTKEFAITFNNFSKTLDKESVLKYMDKSVSALITSTNISKNISKFKSNYKDFENYLGMLADSSKNEVILTYQLTEIVRTYVNEDMGVVTYTADYSLRKRKKMWAKGNETVVLAFKRLESGWRIIHYTTATIEDQKLYGECSCEFVELKDGSFETKILIPSGKGYEEKRNKISFEDVKGGETPTRRVITDNNIYRWDFSSELFFEKSTTSTTTTVNSGTSGIPSEKIGNRIKTRESVIEKIMLYNYAENCKEVKTKKVAKGK